jgi:hypothetical protein
VDTVVSAIPLDGHSVAILRQEVYHRRLTRLVVSGPKGSELEVYISFMVPSARVDRTSRGESNSRDYTNPIFVPAGAEVYAVWPGKAAGYGDARATFGWERA